MRTVGREDHQPSFGHVVHVGGGEWGRVNTSEVAGFPLCITEAGDDLVVEFMASFAEKSLGTVAGHPGD